MKLKNVIFLILFFWIGNTVAKTGYYDSMSLSFGMVNHSVTENESTLAKTDNTETSATEAKEAAKAVSAISLNANYEFLPTQKRTYFLQANVPMLTTGGAGVFLLGGGVNWYLSDLATKYSYESHGSTIEIVPQLKYYWGFNTGIGYLVYNTESSKKTDLFFDLGLHGGGAYAFSPARSLKMELGLARSTGVATTGFKINIFFGVVQYL